MSRALRRHHYKRLKRRTKERMLNNYRVCDRHWINPRTIGIETNTPRRCSCCLCGNQRRYRNIPTVQERKVRAIRGKYRESLTPSNEFKKINKIYMSKETEQYLREIDKIQFPIPKIE